MIDGKEKPKIPSKFAIRAARYNEFHCALCGYFSKHVYVVNCYNKIILLIIIIIIIIMYLSMCI